jgi:hypothetical protein
MMNTAADSISETIHLEFDLACRDLAEAERARTQHDDEAARAHVAACREQVDAVLDMWNESRSGRA